MSKRITLFMDGEDIAGFKSKSDLIEHCLREWEFAAAAGGYFGYNEPLIHEQNGAGGYKCISIVGEVWVE